MSAIIFQTRQHPGDFPYPPLMNLWFVHPYKVISTLRDHLRNFLSERSVVCFCIDPLTRLATAQFMKSPFVQLFVLCYVEIKDYSLLLNCSEHARALLFSLANIKISPLRSALACFQRTSWVFTRAETGGPAGFRDFSSSFITTLVLASTGFWSVHLSEEGNRTVWQKYTLHALLNSSAPHLVGKCLCGKVESIHFVSCFLISTVTF